MWWIQKILRLKLYLSRQKRTINETLIFLKIVLLVVNTYELVTESIETEAAFETVEPE